MGKVQEMVANIRENEKDPQKMKLKEYVAYALGNFSFRSMSKMCSDYILPFYLAIGFSSKQAGMIGSLTKIWDAVNDPITATIIDNRHSSKGRFKPYITPLIPLLAVMSVLMFFKPPTHTPWIQVLWCILVYVAWETTNTFSNVAFKAIATVMSADPNERTAYFTIGGIGEKIADGLPGLLPVFLQLAAPFLSESTFYLICAAIFSALGCAAGLYTTNLKERVVPDGKSEHVWDSFLTFFKNKQLLLLWSSNLSWAISTIGWTVGLFFFKDVVGKPGLQSLLWTLTGLPSFFASMLSPFFLKRFRPSRIVIFNNLVNSGAMLLMYVLVKGIGYDTNTGITILIALSLIGSIPSGISAIAGRVCQVNTFDYMDLKTGQRAEATSLVAVDMLTKGVEAIGKLLVGLSLDAIGYAGDAGAAQTQVAKDGIFLFYALFPAIGTLVSTIPYFFFKLEGKKYDEVMEELKAKKAANLAESEPTELPSSGPQTIAEHGEALERKPHDKE
ncbi:MAG: MFS transporter [Oscillospiraceae bacterium]|jgi:GPH family glycoside/pentoside/hexuronide:cation symporter|nr:MFS transporter [Oscillospiraceae bacterium]